VAALLDDPAVRLLTLTGPGGIGKTRLALAAAAAAADRFSDGMAFVALEAVRRVDQVIPAIAQALRLRERNGQGRTDQLAAFLRGKCMLLVIDNFEQVLAAGPDVAALLTATPRVKALVTSRAPLRVAGEQEMPATPLTLAGERAGLEEILAAEAVQLFVTRARAHSPAFSADEASAPFIADICARLDGLPLAIELAAARANVLAPHQILALLERRLPLLTRGARDAPARHGAMRDAIAWSYDLLAPHEQRLFRRLAVFADGATADALTTRPDLGEHSGSGQASAATILDTVADLVDQNLLVVDVGIDGEPRFRMLETIREFGLEQLTAAGEEDQVHAQHAQRMVVLTRELRPLVSIHARQAPLDRLAAEHANLRDALAWLDREGPAEDFTELAAALGEFWFALGLYREAQLWLDRALTKVDAASAPDRARIYLGYAGAFIGQGDFTRGCQLLDQAIPLAEHAGEPLEQAKALIYRGAILNGSGQYVDAEGPLQAAIAQADRLDDPVLRAAVAGRALDNLSVSARGQGEVARAAACCDEALRLYAGHRLDLAESIVLMGLGASAYDSGDLGKAAPRWLEWITLVGERGDQRQIADALSGIACVATTWGDIRAALLLFGAADALRERVGTAMLWPSDIAAVERSLATLRRLVGEDLVAATLTEGRMLPLAEAVAMAAGVAQPPAASIAADRPQVSLTRREREVLHLMAAQQTDREIAATLFLSLRTVNGHVRSILAKLGVSTRREAVNRARATGVV
jgi:non-specific serine/threonine protein kinase